MTQVPAVMNISYLGCFPDSGSSRDLNGSSTSVMTVQDCAGFCRIYPYFGVQFGSQCYCGNHYGRYTGTVQCTTQCALNSTQHCGGAYANSVYSSKVVSIGNVQLPDAPFPVTNVATTTAALSQTTSTTSQSDRTSSIVLGTVTSTEANARCIRPFFLSIGFIASAILLCGGCDDSKTSSFSVSPWSPPNSYNVTSSISYRIVVSCTMPIHPPYCVTVGCACRILLKIVDISFARKVEHFSGQNMLVGSPRLRAVFSMSPTNRPRQQSRIIIVTNTLFKDDEEKSGEVGIHNHCVTAAGCRLQAKGRDILWVGHDPDIVTGSPKLSCLNLEGSGRLGVPLSPGTYKGWHNYSKNVLWPIFHYYGNRAGHDLDSEMWTDYKDANTRFADAICAEYVRGDIIIVQDYMLMLLPSLLRDRIPTAVIAYFCHIPWPSTELYRSLPVRDELLEGLLGADLVGLQTFSDTRHFMSACARVLGVTPMEQGIWAGRDKFVRVDAYPTGIDAEGITTMITKDSFRERTNKLRDSFGEKKVIVCRNRLEYVKGIPLVLKAYETLLEEHKEWIGHTILVLMCHSNSTRMEEGNDLKIEVDRIVGSINGKFGSIGYTPIQYMNRHVPLEEAYALYAVADLGIQTPLRDGMNLTCHEYILCQQENMNPLILSELAGAAHCLSGTILVNPWDNLGIVDAIHYGLTMTKSQKKIRYQNCLNYVLKHNSEYWLNLLVSEVEQIAHNQPEVEGPLIRANEEDIATSFSSSRRRLILLDYDGTLTPIQSIPGKAYPPRSLIALLNRLSSIPNTHVYVISGRDRKTLGHWLGGLPIGLSCEHGLFFRQCQNGGVVSEWQDLLGEMDLNWKSDVETLFHYYEERTPGSYTEVKEVNITWHYRNADPEFGEYQKNQLLAYLHQMPNTPIDVLNGNKAVEVRPLGINKGSVVRRIMNAEGDVDFVLCIGNDVTDEDMFEELKRWDNIQKCHTVMVEKKPTSASCYVRNQPAVISLLNRLI
ncbi:hypothetical protein PROFUN_02797 [Planoprotostelium fungivorum]|uniref:WSC domain-containing protein n=1 Tax=Planoprotostelium fungivorum TaxID=1890364 RepID=A0A2P6NXL7_9EUKA|nr:hypothetical protein PROFUN_02797 [Planoprotostelium fungivorum]